MRTPNDISRRFFRARTALLRLCAPVLLGAAATAGFIGCHTDGSKPETKHFSVALVMSSPVSDNGWNAGAYKGLQAIQQQLGLDKNDVAYVDNQGDPGGQEKNLRAFAKDHTVVIGHGSEYQEPALKMAKEFPNTLFVITSGEAKIVTPGDTNVMPVVLRLEDGAYLEGMLAAGMSKTGKLGMAGAEKTPPLLSVFDAFAAGAKAVNPKIQILQPVFTDNWDDPNKARAATLPLIDQGADVIIEDLDAAAQGVFNAVKERSTADRPVYALGTNSDLNDNDHPIVLASAPIYVDKAFVQIARAVKAGGFKVNADPFDLKSGVIDFVINPNLSSKIPEALQAKISDARKQIEAHTLKTTSAP